jgi:Haem-binding domain
MKRFLKVLKWLGVAALCAFVGLQFVRPARTNPAFDPSQTIQARLNLPPEVATILDRSCRDCHSYETRWPWYSNVAPASWFLVDHVNEGRENLNLSEWGSLDNRRSSNKLEEICDEVKIGAMPMASYTWIHWSARLSPEDVKTLCDWANAERTRLGVK